LQYRLPNDTAQQHYNTACRFQFTPFNDLAKCYQFSAAVAMFGSLLRSSAFMKNTDWNEVLSLAQFASGQDDLLQKEFISLVQQARLLYAKGKKKKGTD
jgi:Ca-activated chloride channel family protein